MKKRHDAMIKAREENKRKMCLTFDIAGRRIIMETGARNPPSNGVNSSSSTSSSSSSSSMENSSVGGSGTGMFVNPFVERLPLFTLKKENLTTPTPTKGTANGAGMKTQKGEEEMKRKQKKKKTIEGAKQTRIQHEYFPEE
jgi:hypothetical protein